MEFDKLQLQNWNKERELLSHILIGQGMSFVCVHCEHFWWAYENSQASCRAKFLGKECGGPLAKMAFPEYVGILKQGLTKFCFVCGADPDFRVVVRNPEKEVIVGELGCCNKHMYILKDYSAPGRSKPISMTGESLNLKS